MPKGFFSYITRCSLAGHSLCKAHGQVGTCPIVQMRKLRHERNWGKWETEVSRFWWSSTVSQGHTPQKWRKDLIYYLITSTHRIQDFAFRKQIVDRVPSSSIWTFPDNFSKSTNDSLGDHLNYESETPGKCYFGQKGRNGAWYQLPLGESCKSLSLNGEPPLFCHFWQDSPWVSEGTWEDLPTSGSGSGLGCGVDLSWLSATWTFNLGELVICHSLFPGKGSNGEKCPE